MIHKNRVTAALLALLTIFLYARSYAEDIIINIGSGSGKAGAQNSAVPIDLNNSADIVRGVQLYICDENNYLTVRDCVATGRASNFLCVMNECKSNVPSISACRHYPGCANIVLYSTGEAIAAGQGPVALVSYDVAENAPAGCISLNPKKAIVADENRKPFSVMAERGQFCISGGSSNDTTTTPRSGNAENPETPLDEAPTDSAVNNSPPAAAAQSGLRTPMGGSPGVSRDTSSGTDTFSSPEASSRKLTTGSRSVITSGEIDKGSAGATNAINASDTLDPRLIISPSLSVVNSKGMLALDAQTIIDGKMVPGKYKWEILPPSIIGSSIDADGIFTAGTNTSLSPVQEIIRVTDTSNKSISSTATITIEGTKELPDGCALLVTPSSAEIAPGNVITFTATKLGKTCGKGSYQWKVSSKIGSAITGEGVYTAGTNRGSTAALDIIMVKDTEEDLGIDALVTVTPGDQFSPAGSSRPVTTDGRTNKTGAPLLPGTLIAVAAFVTVIGILLVRKKK